jgi:hypothetical protein
MTKFELKTISSVCPANDNLVFDTAVGCKYRAILAHKQCDIPIQMGTIWVRVGREYIAPYQDHYWCVEDTDTGTIIYDTISELQRFFKDTFVEMGGYKPTIVNKTPFLNKDNEDIKILEISGEKWIGKHPQQFMNWLGKTYRDSNYDIIYVADLMQDFRNPHRFSTMADMELEFEGMYNNLSNWLDVNDPTHGMVLVGENGVEYAGGVEISN